METTKHTETTAPELFTGRVKWFNNKAGYGFLTITDGPKNGVDIFVHHTHISVDKEQYKYLVQGEYVEFYLEKMVGGNHEFQATHVCGIKNGKLMCETLHQLNIQRITYKQQRGLNAKDSSEEKMSNKRESNYHQKNVKQSSDVKSQIQSLPKPRVRKSSKV